MVEKLNASPAIPELSCERRTAILDAAQEQFAMHGLAKSTMDEIAAASGMAKASVYYYFPSKDDLFRSVIEREQQEFMRELGKISGMRAPAGRRITLCHRRRFDLFRKLVNLDTANVQSWFTVRPVARELLESLYKAEHALLTALIREGRAAGEFDVPSASRAAAVLLHSLQGLRIRALKTARASAVTAQHIEDLEQDERYLVATFIRGLRTRSEQ
jgi:AcrR family transcriptional regulator